MPCSFFSCRSSGVLRSLAAALVLPAFIASLRADVLVWDTQTGSDGAQDGTGTWTAGLPNWFNQTQSLQNQVWVNGSDAVFGSAAGSAAGTITLSSANGGIVVGGLTFNAPASGSYTLGGSGPLTLSGSTVTTNAAAAISTVLAGNTAWSKEGSAQLTLSGSAANTNTGLLSVNAGRVHLAKSGNTTALAGDLTLSTGGAVTFSGGTNQIAATSSVILNGAASVFNGTGPNATATTVTQTLASLTISGGTFNAGANSVWDIGAVSFIAGENKVFVGNSGSKQTYGSLSLVGMSGIASSTAVANGFTIFGNGGTLANRTTLTIGAGGLSMDGSRIHLGSGTSGSELVLNGDVTTSGASSFIDRETGTGLLPYVSLSGTAGVAIRTFNIGATLTISPVIQNGAATTASLVKSGTGSLVFNGGEANTYTGDTTINDGTFVLNKTAGVTAVAGNIIVNSGGVLQLSASNQIADTAGITLNGGTMTAWNTDERIAFFTQNSGNLASSGNTGHVEITGALTLAGGGQLVINSNPGSVNPASWNVGGVVLSGADILIGGSNGAGNPRTSLTIGAGGLTMLGRTITMNVGDAGVVLNLNGDYFGSGSNNILTNSSSTVQPLIEIGSATRTFNVLSGGTTTIGVIVNGTGGSLIKTGGGLLQFTAAGAYTGTTTVSGGTLSLAGTGGGLSGTTGIVVNNGGVFQNGSPTSANNNGATNRINTAATLTLAGGTFNHMTAAAGAHTQDLAGVTINGGSNTMNVSATAGTTATLTFTGASPYSHTAGTVNFVQNPAGGASILFANAPSGAGNVSGGLLVGAILNGTDLIAAQSGVLTAYSGWVPTGTDTWTNGAAMDVTGSNPAAFAAETINALRFNSAGAFTITLAGMHTIDSGMLLVTTGVGANASIITGGELRGPAGGELVVAQYNTAGSLEIASNVVDNTSATAMIKAGGGTLVLSGTNTYTGSTRVNEGVLQAADGTGLSSSSALVLNGGVFQSTVATFSRALGSSAGEVSLIGGSTGFSAASTALTVNLGGSGATVQWGAASFNPGVLLLNASSATASLTFQNGIDLNGTTRGIRVDANTAIISGVISNSVGGSPAGLVKSGSGTLRLTQANSFDGGMTLSGGTLAVGNDAALGAGDLTLSGGTLQADGAARTLANDVIVSTSSTLGGSQTLTLSGAIAGSGTLTKSGTSVVALAGNNTYTGVTNVTAGIVRLLSNTALGSTAGATSVSGAAQVELADGVVVTGETITISTTTGTTGDGSPTTNRGGLQAAVNATAEWAGDVIIGANQARIGVQEGGTLTISGTISDGANSFDVRLSGELTGTGGLILSGAGNAWDGQTEIVRGKVLLGIDNALPAASVLDIHFTSSNNAEYAGVDMNGFNQTVSSLRNEGNTGANAELTNSSRTLSTLTINETSAITYGGIITGNLALVKNGAGTLTLSQSNRFTGGITVNEGVLQISNSTALAGGNVTINGGAGSAGKLDLNNISTTINALNGSAGTVAAVIANESATAATRTLTIGVNHGSGTYAGNLLDNSGGAALGLVALTKIGAGTQTLSGTNTHSGSTTVSNGTLVADYAAGSPLSVNSTIVMNGGTLVIANATTATIGAITEVHAEPNYTTGVIRIQDGATVTTGTFTVVGYTPFLIDLSGGGTFVANTLSGAAVTNGVLIGTNNNRATTYVQDDSGTGFATYNVSNEIVRYTGGTALTASNSSSTTNYVLSSDLVRTAALSFQTLQIDTTGSDVTLDMGSGNISVAGNGRSVLVSGSNDATITGSGAITGGSFYIANYSSGTATLGISLSAQTVIASGPGLIDYTNAANPNDLYVAGSVFRITGGDRDYSNNLIRIYGGGVLELGADLNGAASGDFSRVSGTSTGQVALIGNGGFSAHGADRVVALGGVGTATALTWGTSGFLSGPGGDNNYSFMLGSAHSTHTVEFQNAINLGTRERRLEVADGTSSTNVDARLTGQLSGTGGVVKEGAGRLEFTAANTYSGATQVNAGSLVIAPGGSTGTGAVSVSAGAALLGSGTVAGSSFTLAANASLHAGAGTLSADMGTLSVQTAATGALFDLQTGSSVVLDVQNANATDSTFGGHAIGSVDYNSYLDSFSGLGSGTHDLLVFDGGAGSSLVWDASLLVRPENFTASSGQIFNLIDWSSAVDADFSGFDAGVNYRTGADDNGLQFDLPELTGGLYWDISRFTTSGVIAIVPEPGRALLLMLGLLPLMLRRRRR